MVAALARAGMATLLVLAIITIAPGRVLAEQEDTPLQARAKEVLRAAAAAQTRDARVESRERLLAMADSLEAAGEDVLASHCLERAGMVGYRLAEYQSARDIWGRGLIAARRSGDRKRIAALLNAQAIGVSITGDNEGAIALQTELVAMRQELKDVRGEGVSWHNLAFSYFALFRYPEAIEAISNAMRRHREAGNAFGLAASMGTLANALFEVGRAGDAMAMADSAVARARPLGNPSVLGQALQGRGRQLHYAGRYDESLADYEAAHDVLTSAGVVHVAAVSDLNWANALISLERCDEARDVVDAAMKALAPVGNPPALVWGECVSARITAHCGEANDARAALIATIDHLEAIRDSIPEELSRADAFRMAGDAYTDLALLDIADGKPEGAWRTIESSTGRLFRDALGLGERSPSPDLLTRLQTRLADVDGIALQFGHTGVDRSVVCIVTPSAVYAAPMAITPGFRLDAAAALKLMSSGATDEECRPFLERIAAVALAPVAEALTHEGIRVVVFPGGLAGFPMETLPLPGANGTTLGERFAVTYAPSATAFLHLQEREAKGSAVLVFADPALGVQATDGVEIALRSARMNLTQLPEARAEGEAIGQSGEVLVGGDATRAAFLERAGDAAVLHLAAHAVVDGARPEYSAIVLAGEGGDMLTVGDLRELSLSADLVSVSGCETAGGYIATGDGAFGLTRAFLLAGARSVVSSWWDVEDSAARRFMELYYEGLRGGEARDVALQKARATMAGEGFSLRDRSAFALAGATAQPVAALAHPAGGSAGRIGGSAAVVMIIILAAAARRRRARHAIKHVLLALTLVALTHGSAGAGTPPSLDMLAWLEGDWVRDTKRGQAMETWKRVSENTMEGVGRLTYGDSTRVTEYLRIERFGDEIFFTAKPGQNPLPTSFKMTECREGRVVFENPNHDFPQRIVYTRNQQDGLSAHVEGVMDGETHGIDFEFTRKK